MDVETTGTEVLHTRSDEHVERMHVEAREAAAAEAVEGAALQPALESPSGP